MKFFFYSKKRLIAGYLKYIHSFGVVLSYSHSRVCQRQKSLFQTSSALFCATLHWNRLAPEATQRTKKLNVFSPSTHQTQRAVEFQKQFKKLQGVKVMLHDDDQRNDDFQRNAALQHFCGIVQTFQCCVARKIVLTNLLVWHYLQSKSQRVKA